MRCWAAVALAMGGLSAADVAQAEEVDLTAVLNLEYGANFEGENVLGRASLDLEALARPTDWMSLTAIGRVQADFVDKLEPGRPDQSNRSPASRRLFAGDEGEFALREFYADINIDDIFIRVGKQQIVWGQADGLKVLDVVNPQSFREFILDDFDNSRTPLWSVSAQIPVGNAVLELVWVPDTTYSDVPSPDAYFAIRSPQLILPPTIDKGLIIEDPDRPNRFFADSDVGFSLTALVGNWDLSLNYLYQYNNLPQYLYADDAFVTRVTPRYLRTHMFGGSFSTSVGDFTFRGEVAYFSNRSFTTSRLVEPAGSTTSSEISYVLGVDWTGISDTFISAQLFQSYLPDYAPGMVRGELESNLTFLVRHTFNNDLTKAEIRDVTNIDHGDGYVQLSFKHELTDKIGIGAKVVVFYGDRLGVFGQFRDRDYAQINFSISL